MPVIKRYKVTQTREVIVEANDEVGAMQIASAAFKFGQNKDNHATAKPHSVWGDTISKIEPTATYIEKV